MSRRMKIFYFKLKQSLIFVMVIVNFFKKMIYTGFDRIVYIWKLIKYNLQFKKVSLTRYGCYVYVRGRGSKFLSYCYNARMFDWDYT